MSLVRSYDMTPSAGVRRSLSRAGSPRRGHATDAPRWSRPGEGGGGLDGVRVAGAGTSAAM
jgi:hypothetical protein